MSEGLMSGKRVLVTGAGTGIGRGVGLGFARAGADVAFHYAHSAAGAEMAATEARSLGVRAEAFGGDFAVVEEARRVASQAVDFLGGLDVLVNNAGITMNVPFADVTVEQFDTLYNVNIRAMFFVTQTCLPALLASQGAIVNMTSVHALQAMNEHSVYAGTKGAIISFTRQLAIELIPSGVHVNAVAPGAVLVENHFKVVHNMNPEALGAGVPVGYMGRPDDIANACIFLASPQARFIIGQTLVVDGGTTSWMPFGDGYKAKLDANFGAGYVAGL